MDSRTAILEKIRQNQPEISAKLPDVEVLGLETFDLVEKYTTVLQSIGGEYVEVKDYNEIINFVKDNYSPDKRVVTTFPELAAIGATNWMNDDPHSLADVELAVVKAHFGVAENSALWVTDAVLGQRATPFIAQYLAIVLSKQDIVATMHQAYQLIGDSKYDFGTFIAGPSKTADIEQSLVLGAHGARGLVVFLLT